MTPPHPAPVRIRVATYNIHRSRGLDGRTSAKRIADVIASLEADIIALQEVVGASASAAGHAAELGALLGMGWVMAPTRRLRGHLFGNVVLSRFPVRYHTQYDLPTLREPRCCQRVDLAIDDHTLHLYNVHLGTGLLERRGQAVRLAEILDDRHVRAPKIMLGDFNEWIRGPATRVLTERLQSLDLRSHLRRRRTYPGVFPVLHLDHLYFKGEVQVLEVVLPRTRKTLIASDHLPLVAELAVR